MPGKWRFSLIAFVACIAATTALIVGACPFCPPTDATLSEKLSESDAACVVKFLDSQNGEQLSMQTTTFQVVKTMPAKEVFPAGAEIVTTFGVTANPGDHFLLMGQMKEGTMEWSLPIPLDELGSEYEYTRKAPSPEQPQLERLTYFLKYLDHKNSVISNDAFGEFARAKFEDVEQLGEKISRAKVRRWLEDPNPQLDVRRAFYGMLLGLCGSDDDAEFLKLKILAPIDPEKNRLGIEGMMGGYLLLRGEAGLRMMLEQKVDSLPADMPSNDPRFVDLNALRMTLNFLWDYRRRQFSDESLRAAMRRYLDRPEFADLAIVDLARWKDWIPLERLIGAYGREPWESLSAKEKIVAYALNCRKDIPTAAGAELPTHAIKAQTFLDRLDPEFVQSVKRGGGGLVPVFRKPATSNGLKKSPP